MHFSFLLVIYRKHWYYDVVKISLFTKKSDKFYVMFRRIKCSSSTAILFEMMQLLPEVQGDVFIGYP